MEASSDFRCWARRGNERARRAITSISLRSRLARAPCRPKNDMRGKVDFARRFKLIWIAQSSREKHFAFNVPRSVASSRHPASPCALLFRRGRFDRKARASRATRTLCHDQRRQSHRVVPDKRAIASADLGPNQNRFSSVHRLDLRQRADGAVEAGFVHKKDNRY
jgi:hypothetical protein